MVKNQHMLPIIVKKNNRRIVAGGTPPKDSYDELKIAVRDYNL